MIQFFIVFLGKRLSKKFSLKKWCIKLCLVFNTMVLLYANHDSEIETMLLTTCHRILLDYLELDSATIRSKLCNTCRAYSNMPWFYAIASIVSSYIPKLLNYYRMQCYRIIIAYLIVLVFLFVVVSSIFSPISCKFWITASYVLLSQ